MMRDLEAELARARVLRPWIAPSLAPEDSVVLFDDAALLLRRRFFGEPNIGALCQYGYLQEQWTVTGKRGVTPNSFASEMEFRQSANAWRKFIRLVSRVTRFI
jgi:hypothetical protein